MKFLDYSNLFDGDPAYLALLSTYQFDPDYLERRLLRCEALAKARRIAGFVDARHWQELLRQDLPARLLNRRYLVVPVRRSGGVFHPKLNLLLTEGGGQVQCGSANLTRCGCSSNLELLNAFPFGGADCDGEAVLLALEAFVFFRRACDEAEGESGRICRAWLDEATAALPWLKLPPERLPVRRVKLLLTYNGGLWPHLADSQDAADPAQLMVSSPFHDFDAEMFNRVRTRWPDCHIETLVQQKVTALPVRALAGEKDAISLAEL